VSDNAELLIEGPEDGVIILTLNRPKKMNALATSLLEALASAVEACDLNDEVRAIVITGGAKVFAAGADVNEILPKGSPEGLSDLRPAIWNRIRTARKPIIAAVEGFCLGAGNELLMCADICVAGEGARFGQPETNLGIIPGAGGAALLPRIVGQQRAMRMVLLGEFITATEALNYGLISEIVADGDATEKAKSIGLRIAKRAPIAIMQGKAVVKASHDLPLQAHLNIERQAFSLLFSTEDKKEGVEAFIQKRKPNWQGK
jgi:enoyl-CoA hydratase